MSLIEDAGGGAAARGSSRSLRPALCGHRDTKAESVVAELKKRVLVSVEQVMTNFDHSIREGADQELKQRPNEAVGAHSAREFRGDVFFDGEEFVEVVNRYHEAVDVVRAPTLEQLMRDVNEKWGRE